MSITAMAAARQITDITPTEKFVLMALCDYASDQGIAWPSLNTLRTWTLLSRRGINTAIAGLETKGLIERRATVRKNGSQTSNTYRLMFVEADAETADRFFGVTGGVQEVHPPHARGASPELPLERPEEPKPLSATPTLAEPKSYSSREEHLQTLVNTWNSLCGALPSVKALSAARRTKLKAFVKEAGGFDAAQEILKKATLAVARDDWWIRGKYGLDNLLAGGKVFQRAESYEALEEPSVVSVEVGDQVRVWVAAGAQRVVGRGKVTEVTDSQVVLVNPIGLEIRVPKRDVIKVES